MIDFQFMAESIVEKRSAMATIYFAERLAQRFVAAYILVIGPGNTASRGRARRDEMDARIGTLNSGKFYAYVNGYSAEPVTGSLAEVETALGLRAPAKPVRKVRAYIVTVTPGVESWNVKAYDLKVNARDRNDAIKQARQQYDETVGVRNNGGATCRASLAKSDDPRVSGFNVEFLGAQRPVAGDDY